MVKVKPRIKVMTFETALDCSIVATIEAGFWCFGPVV